MRIFYKASGSTKEKRKQWPLFSYMTFMDHIIEIRPTKSLRLCLMRLSLITLCFGKYPEMRTCCTSVINVDNDPPEEFICAICTDVLQDNLYWLLSICNFSLIIYLFMIYSSCLYFIFHTHILYGCGLWIWDGWDGLWVVDYGSGKKLLNGTSRIHLRLHLPLRTLCKNFISIMARSFTFKALNVKICLFSRFVFLRFDLA